MKYQLSLLALLLIFNVSAFSQLAQPGKFNYTDLENKTLLIPEFNVDSDYAKKLVKKGKYDKLKSTQEKADYYNKIWQEAMATSSWDATPYEIRGYDQAKLLKEKNEKVLILYYLVDKMNNWYANILVCGPKKITVATAPINGFDLSDAKELRLMMNMLNQSLNDAMDIAEEEEGGKVSRKDKKNKYKENFIAFYEKMPKMTFVVPILTVEDFKKYDKYNEETRDALKEGWKACPYKVVPRAELEELRTNGDPSTFYWRNITIYSSIQGIPIPMRYNVLLTADRDEVVFAFMGSKVLKGSTLEEIQKKMAERSLKYKAQLAN